jgi:spore coat protein A, manganese oxidase
VLPGWTDQSPTPRPTSAPVTESKVTLEEVMGRGGKPVMAVVKGVPFMTRDENGTMTHEPDEPFTTEVVQNGSTVDWLYLNLTADSHPFHTHLAHFEVISRQPFDAVGYEMALHAARAELDDGDRLDPAEYPDLDPYVLGPEVPAPATECGPKDTVIANPGEITRIRLRFDLPAGAGDGEHRYVYHCHILEHEENEMMRPLVVENGAD